MRLPTSHRQGGAGLVELLVGLTTGLLVVAAAIGTLVISRGASASISDIGQLQQQGSYALRTIGMQLRQAGSLDAVRDNDSRLYAFNNLPSGYGTTGASVFGTDGADGASDVLSVASQSSSSAHTQSRDCLGNGAAAGTKVESTFRRNRNAELTCFSATDTAQPLVANVADFQVSYRVTTATGIRTMDAADVSAAGLWGAVKAIEVCLDLQGNERHPDMGSTYLDCKGASVARAGRVHLVFRNVFSVRTRGA